MEIYIDRSLVEAFFNDTKSISMRSYAAYDAQKVELFADGDVVLDDLYIAKMKSIYDRLLQFVAAYLFFLSI